VRMSGDRRNGCGMTDEASGALVIGEALIDEVTDGVHARRHPGGSPANVAIGLGRLGVDVTFHTAIGADADGEMIAANLRRSGVVLTEESWTTTPTSRAIARLNAEASATYDFRVDWSPHPLRHGPGHRRVVHGGSIGAFLHPGAEIVRESFRAARRGGGLVTFDPNIRPALLPGRERTVKSFELLAGSSHLTKLSDEDAAFLYPGATIDDVLNRLIEMRVPVAAVTLGSRGARLASGDVRIDIPSVVTDVVDTVGAGDSFMAALIWALVFRDWQWSGGVVPGRILRSVGFTATRAAAITVSRRGADLPNAAELGGRRFADSTESAPAAKESVEEPFLS